MDIRRYLGLLWRWAWLILVSIVVAGGIAFLVSKTTTPIYQAKSTLLIDEGPGGDGNDYSNLLRAQRLALGYLEMMKTRPVLVETINRLQLPLSAAELNARIAVSAPPETPILIAIVEDTDPDRAAEIANTLGEVFIAQLAQLRNTRFTESIRNSENRLQGLEGEVDRLQRAVDEFGPAETTERQRELAQLQTKLNEAKISYTDAFESLTELQLEMARTGGNVVIIERAEPSAQPVRPRIMTNTILAAALGALLAVGLVFVLEYFDDTVKSPDQVLADSGLSTLGTIAEIKNLGESGNLIANLQPRDPISEAYRVLRTNLSFSAVDEGLRSLLVTSSSPGEGKSTTISNLAVVIAQMGKKVILVDSDLRRPVLHRIFELSNSQGLTTAILNPTLPLSDHLQATAVPGLRVMTSGPTPPNPAEMLESNRMSHIIDALQNEADMVLFDTPPVLTVTDASILASQLDGCLLVVDTGRTRRNVFIQAADRLRQANSHLFGVVLNRLQLERRGYYYYHYYDYHYYSSQAEQPRESRSIRQRAQSQAQAAIARLNLFGTKSSKLNWLTILANLLLIIGGSFILASFSFNIFSAARAGTPLFSTLGEPAFLRPFFLGLLLFGSGLAVSSQRVPTSNRRGRKEI